MFWDCGNIVTTIVIVVARLDLLVEDGIIVALIEHQNTVMPKRGIVFGQGLAAIVFIVQMRKRIPKANHGIIEVMYTPV